VIRVGQDDGAAGGSGDADFDSGCALFRFVRAGGTP